MKNTNLQLSYVKAVNFRAALQDAFAFRAYGAIPGIQILSSLGGDIEPSFNLFATHPSLQDRVLALQKLHAESHSPGATRIKNP